MRCVFVMGTHFQLTTSQGGRPSLIIICSNTFSFQLTTSQGGRLFHRAQQMAAGTFNSRPHKEVDNTLSIFLDCFTKLSTHDLTRRSTVYFYSVDPDLVFQLTTSQGGRHDPDKNRWGTTIFQLTTSQGGRPFCPPTSV